MWPTLVELEGGAGVHTYGLFILLAFCSAFLLVLLRARRVGFDPDRLPPIYLAAAAGGLPGGRLLYALAVEPVKTFSDPSSLLSMSGFAVYGGVMGGAIAVGSVAKFQGFDAWKLADIAAPAVILGYGVGRVGCFFAGCCHGAIAPIGPDPTGLLPASFTGGQLWLSGMAPFLTNEVYGGVGRLHDVPLYPTQLWAGATAIALAFALSLKWERRGFDGQIAALALMLEPILRFLIESFRADHRGYAIQFSVPDAIVPMLPPGMTRAGADIQAGLVGLTTSQAIAAAAILFGAAIYIMRRNLGVAPEIPIAADHDLLGDLDD